MQNDLRSDSATFKMGVPSPQLYLLAVLVAVAAVLPGWTGRRADLVGGTAALCVGCGVGVRDFVALAAAAAVLVDLQRVDAPVCALEGCGVVLDEGVAGGGVGGAASAGPDVAGPVTAECDVEDLVMLVVTIGCSLWELTIWRFLKCEEMSQSPEKLAAGVPQVVGSGLPLVISEGMLELAKNQMLMAESVHSVA